MVDEGQQKNQNQQQKQNQLAELMIAQNFVILDIEYIQISKHHKCIRKIHMLAKNGFMKLTKEFYPCWKFNKLEDKYQRAFLYCRKNIHGLSYSPPKMLQSPQCQRAKEVLKYFITMHKFDFILFKGGTVERDLCSAMNIPAYNVEIFDIDKAGSHSPEEEVDFYFRQLIKQVSFYPM